MKSIKFICFRCLIFLNADMLVNTETVMRIKKSRIFSTGEALAEAGLPQGGAVRPKNGWIYVVENFVLGTNCWNLYIPLVPLWKVRGFVYFLKDIPLLISRHMVCKQKWDKRKSR